MERRYAMRVRGIVAAGVLVAVTLVVGADQAGAAGITTHQWMARTAIPKVANPQLRSLLTAHVDMVNAGAAFPDVGYVGSNTYGETAHWQRFVDNLIDATRARTDCGDLTDPAGPCAGLIAFTFGVAAHGMGDEVWDWLFEPNSPDRNEYWTGVPSANDGGAETQMDIVAIGRYGVGRTVSTAVPDIPLVLQALADSGEPGVSASQFDLVPNVPLLWGVEKGWSDQFLGDVEAAMPWMSANLVTAPGGVDFAATAIVGYWSSIWGRLLGDQPATHVSITYPAPGETDVPVTGWDRASFQPGSAPGRGGARNRITAVLTSARPYATGATSAVSDQMPDGSMTITDMSTGAELLVKDGYPRSVPYGSDAGEHTIDVQPTANLAACRWYRVDVGAAVPILDSRQVPVTSYSWTFRTACGEEAPGRAPGSTKLPDPSAPTTTLGTDRPGAHHVPTPAPVARPVKATPTYAG